MAMKARSGVKPIKNPFMKKDVPLISQELQDASRQNLREAIEKTPRPQPLRRRPSRGGSDTTTGAVRG